MRFVKSKECLRTPGHEAAPLLLSFAARPRPLLPSIQLSLFFAAPPLLPSPSTRLLLLSFAFPSPPPPPPVRLLPLSVAFPPPPPSVQPRPLSVVLLAFRCCWQSCL